MPTLYKRSYTYDASGNRLTQTVNGETTTYTYDDADRLIGEERPDGGLVTYTYDDAGNQTVKESPEGDTYTTYDAANQATVIEPPGGAVELTYNAYYQRVRKENASGQVTKYLYDHKRLLAETDDLDVTTKSYTSRTQNTGSGSEGYGDLISEYDPETLTQAYPAYDAQWNTRELTDDSGDITASYRNTAFGLVSPEAQADWCSMSTDQWDGLSVEGWEALPVCSPQGPFGYGGQAGYYRDPELELYLMGMGGRGRYYDPAAGRFISRDPSGLGGGDLNLYRYVGNNPVNAIDPSGNEAIGHHWMTVNSLTTLLNEGKITPDAFRLGMGYYSGPTNPPHRGRHNNEVDARIIQLFNRDFKNASERPVTARQLHAFINNTVIPYSEGKLGELNQRVAQQRARQLGESPDTARPADFIVSETVDNRVQLIDNSRNVITTEKRLGTYDILRQHFPLDNHWHPDHPDNRYYTINDIASDEGGDGRRSRRNHPMPPSPPSAAMQRSAAARTSAKLAVVGGFLTILGMAADQASGATNARKEELFTHIKHWMDAAANNSRSRQKLKADDIAWLLSEMIPVRSAGFTGYATLIQNLSNEDRAKIREMLDNYNRPDIEYNNAMEEYERNLTEWEDWQMEETIKLREQKEQALLALQVGIGMLQMARDYAADQIRQYQKYQSAMRWQRENTRVITHYPKDRKKVYDRTITTNKYFNGTRWVESSRSRSIRYLVYSDGYGGLEINIDNGTEVYPISSENVIPEFLEEIRQANNMLISQETVIPNLYDAPVWYE